MAGGGGGGGGSREGGGRCMAGERRPKRSAPSICRKCVCGGGGGGSREGWGEGGEVHGG